MVLTEKSKINQNKNSFTQYLTIPSSLARDSQYPFKKDEEVEILIKLEEKELVIRGVGDRGDNGKKAK